MKRKCWLVMAAFAIMMILAVPFGTVGAQAPELAFELAQQICQQILAKAPSTALSRQAGIWILDLPLDPVLIQNWLGPELFGKISLADGSLNWEALSGAFDFLGGKVTAYRPRVGSPPDSLSVELRGEFLDPVNSRKEDADSTPVPPKGGSPAGGGNMPKFSSPQWGVALAALLPLVIVFLAVLALGNMFHLAGAGRK